MISYQPPADAAPELETEPSVFNLTKPFRGGSQEIWRMHLGCRGILSVTEIFKKGRYSLAREIAREAIFWGVSGGL